MKNSTSKNRRGFDGWASKIVHEWNVHLEIFSRPQAKEKYIVSNIGFSEQIVYRKQSLGAPDQ